MLTSKFLRDIMIEARPIIERQLDDAELIAGLRDVFTAQGGDWGALKALIKSQVQDERDEAGDGKRIRKLRDRSGNQLAYADMLGLGNMNENNSFADDGEIDVDVVVSDTIDRDGNRLKVTVDSRIAAILAKADNAPAHDPETGEITEPQAAPRPASDLIAPSHGQVAPIQPATAAPSAEPERASAEDGQGAATPVLTHSPVTATVPQDGAAVARGAHIPEVAGSIPAPATSSLGEESDKSAGASAPAAPAPKYAAPGVVVMEHDPPEPVKWHPYANCFPTVLGEDLKALEAVIHARFGAVEKPIVKIGNLILDGRARYGIARSMLIDYPVVQYAGTDPLIDLIAWNLESRDLTPAQISATAKNLAKLEPSRADEIMAAFGLQIAEAAE